MIWVFPLIVTLVNRFGKYPLHLACEYSASLDVIEELTKRSAIVSETDFEQKSPIDYAWTEFLTRRATFESRSNFCSLNKNDPFNIVVFLVTRACNCVDSLQMVKTSENVLWCVLKLGDKCPFSLLEFLLKTFPHLVIQKDNNGRLPLHYCCIFSTSSKSDFCKRLEIIVNAFPAAAAISDTSSRVPLHYALINNQLDPKTHIRGLKVLLAAAPSSLHLVDPVTGLLPFMMASTNEINFPCIEISMWLLLKDPSLLTTFISSIEQTANRGQTGISTSY